MSDHLRSRLLALALTLSAGAVWSVPAGASEPTRVDPVRAQPRQSQIVRREPAARVELPTRGELAARAALQAVGTAYRWGGESPATGFDCSGLVRWAYRQVGVDLPHNSYALYDVGRAVPGSKLAPGDILFFEGLGHVGLYVGRGRMVHAPQTGRDVEIVRLGSSGFGDRMIGARRVTTE